jgi:hypothetical protein
MRPKKQKTPAKKVWLEAFAPVAKDLRLAQRRVAKVGAARWFFEFAYADLEALSAGDLINCGFDILAIVISKDLKTLSDDELFEAYGTFRLLAAPEAETWEEIGRLQRAAKAGKIPVEDVQKNTNDLVLSHLHVPRRLLVDFHQKLRQAFEAFFTGRGDGWEHKRPAVRKRLLCRGVKPESGVWPAQDPDNPEMKLPPVERLIFVAGEAVIREQKKFGVCARCGKPFIAEKNPLRKHCSETCANYLRVNRHRGRLQAKQKGEKK